MEEDLKPELVEPLDPYAKAVSSLFCNIQKCRLNGSLEAERSQWDV